LTFEVSLSVNCGEFDSDENYEYFYTDSNISGPEYIGDATMLYAIICVTLSCMCITSLVVGFYKRKIRKLK